MVRRFADADIVGQRRLSVEIRLGLYEQPVAPEILDPLLAAWRAQRAGSGAPSAVRSSALIEDRKGANFAGQFESFLGIDDEAAFLTAVRACWAALWTTNARRYMDNHGLSPADTAMAVLIQPLVDARAAGGGLSETAEGQMLISATWGLGSAIAQGEVVPDRILLNRQGFLRKIEAGRKDHRETCGHGAGAMPQAVPSELVGEPCLDAGQAVTLGRLMRKAEAVMGGPVEIEWALDDAGFKLLAGAAARGRADPRAGRDLAQASRPQRPSRRHRLGRRPRRGGELRMRAGAGGAGRRAGDAGRGSGAEPGAAACRRRGRRAWRLDLASRLAGARARHPDGAGRARRHQPHPGRLAGRGRRGRRRRAVALLMRANPARPRIFVTQPVAKSALDRLREVATVKVNPDASRILAKTALIAAVKKCDILFCLLHDRIDRDVIAANPKLRLVAAQSISPSNIDVAAATAQRLPVTVVPPVTTEATADLTFGLMLAVARRMMEGDRLVRAGKFPGGQSSYLLGSFVWGKTIGLIGGGGLIGRAVARRANGFSMRVLYWTPRRKPESLEREAGLTFVPLDQLLAESDFVSLHSPLKPETRHQIGARELKLMKKTAFLINTARGPIIDEAALVRALRARRIAGAGLDVFEHEPKVDAALRKLPNVVLVPHLGSATVEVRDEMANIVVDNILALLDGKTPPNCVNPEVLRGS